MTEGELIQLTWSAAGHIRIRIFRYPSAKDRISLLGLLRGCAILGGAPTTTAGIERCRYGPGVSLSAIDDILDLTGTTDELGKERAPT